MNPSELWLFLPFGYVVTVGIELPILVAGLSKRVPLRSRVLAGFMLTAVTYPIVVLVMPLTLEPSLGYAGYLWVAEIFAPAAECVLLRLAFLPSHENDLRIPEWRHLRDYAVVVVANLASFGIGILLDRFAL